MRLIPPFSRIWAFSNLLFILNLGTGLPSSQARAACAEEQSAHLSTFYNKALDTYQEACLASLKATGALELDRSPHQKLSVIATRAAEACGESIWQAAQGLLNTGSQLLADEQEIVCRQIEDLRILSRHFTKTARQLMNLDTKDFTPDSITCRNRVEILIDKGRALNEFLFHLDDLLANELRGLVCEPVSKIAEVICPMMVGSGISRLSRLTRSDILKAFQDRGIYITVLSERQVLWATREYQIVRGKVGGRTVHKAIDRRTGAEMNLVVDAKTGVIELTEDMRSVLQSIIKEAPVAQAGNRTVLSIVDIDDLGITNKFPGGQSAGDQYIKAVTESLKSEIDPGAIIVKSKGDEYYILFQNTNPQAVQAQLHRARIAVQKNPEAQKVFNTERVQRQQDKVRIENAKSFNEFPPLIQQKVRERLAQSESGKKLLESDLNSPEKLNILKVHALAEQEHRIRQMRGYSPDISPGSSEVAPTTQLTEAVEQASKQVDAFKLKSKELKNRENLDKHGGGGDVRIELNPDGTVKVPLPLPAPTR